MCNTNTINKSIGKRLNYYRKLRKISLKELSERTGIREKYLKKIEEGMAIRLSIGTLEIITKSFGLEVKEFFHELEKNNSRSGIA